MPIHIVNYKYQVDGKVHWFVDYSEAMLHFKFVYPELFSKCIDPARYISMVSTQVCAL